MSDLGHAALARRLYLHVLNGGQVTARDMARLVEKIEELEQKLADDPADAIWAEFKDRWDGEKKYALRQIIRWLKNTPGGETGGECPPRADGSGEDG